MPHTKATDSLSAAAQAAMSRGFAAGWAAERIARAVKDETGEAVAPRTVARRAAEWRDKKRRYEAARDQCRAMKEAGFDGAQMIEALAFERLIENPDALVKADPIEFHSLGLAAKKVALKEREVAARERSIAIDERKMKLLEDREQRVRAAADPKVAMTPEERLAEIRGIYGLPESPAVPNAERT